MSGGYGFLTIVPSSLAVLIKLIIFLKVKNSVFTINRWFLTFFISLVGLNVCEIICFTMTSQPEQSLPYLVAYYIFAILSSLSLLGLSLDISGHMNDMAMWTIRAIGATNVICLFVPGLVLAGASSIGYSLTRVAGPLYPIVQSTILTAFLITGYLLINSAINNKCHIKRGRSLLMMIAIFPTLLTGAAVIIAMQAGAKINAAVFISVSIIFFLVVFIYTEKKQKLFGLLSLVPKTDEYRLLNEIKPVIFNDSPIDLSRAMSEIEYKIILRALKQHNNNRSETARFLNISRPTLQRKLQRNTDWAE